jgi:hypothetical protein
VTTFACAVIALTATATSCTESLGARTPAAAVMTELVHTDASVDRAVCLCDYCSTCRLWNQLRFWSIGAATALVSPPPARQSGIMSDQAGASGLASQLPARAPPVSSL